MSFLRKWGNSSGPTGSNGGNGAAAAEAAKVEWYNETPGERYFGMENFGNTCYANSVLQSLYFSKPFRDLVIYYEQEGKYAPSSPAPPSLSHSYSMASSMSQPSSSGPPSIPSMAGSTTLKPSSSRGAGVTSPTGGGRPSFFGGHKRQASTSGQDTASLTDSQSSGGFTGGAPLTQATTQSSFTGVGTPSLANGNLALERPAADVNLLTTLHDLFAAISSQTRTTGTVAPQAFINQLKRENEFFRSTLHQDAHEFLNYLINMIAEALEKEEKERIAKGLPSAFGIGLHGTPRTWVHQLFEGVLTNETRCLSCETVTSRDEAFLDLSIDIEQNSSVTACLRQFSASEMLCQRNKFSCDKCCGLQEAEKRMKIKKLPSILALHLKRFKYEESLQRHVKLTYRVVFPFELRLFNTADDVSNPDRLYELWAIVVHIGAGPHHGHYITIVKSGARWIVFDDNNVYPIDETDIPRYFGDTPGQGSGYVLFYQAVDLDMQSLGVPSRARTESTATSSAQHGSALPDSTVQAAPSIAGLGLAMNEEDMAAARAPMSTTASTQPLGVPIETDAASPTPTGPLPVPTDPRKLGVPFADTASTSTSGSSKENGSPVKETSGWSVKGRKMSVGARIGRSLSLVSTNNEKKEPLRTVSTPFTNAAQPTDLPSTATLPPPAPFASGPFSAEPDSIPLSAEMSSRTDSQASQPVVTIPNISDSAEATPPTAHSSGSTTPAYQRASNSFGTGAGNPPPPPSDDGSASTVSTQGLSVLGGPSPQRRGSRASVDLSNSSFASSAGQGGAGGALAATRSFLSRKARPLSTVASSSSVPTTKDLGLSAQASGAPPRPVTAGGRLSHSSTTTNEIPAPLENGHGMKAGVPSQAAPESPTPALPMSLAAPDDGGAPLSTTSSVQLSKKELEKAEKRLKELRKQREKEERRRAEDQAKRVKEEERRLKDEAKKADKLRRKMSAK